MFQEIRNDMDHRHGTAQLLVGDLNASINKHNVLQSMITKDGWTDLGAVASRWGGGKMNKTTCKANKKAKATRIDHVLASPEVLKHVTSFDAVFNPAIPTHARMDITLTTPTITEEVNVQNKPTPLCEELQSFIDKGAECMDTEKEKLDYATIIMDTLKVNIDNFINAIKAKLNNMAKQWDTNAFWKHLSIAIGKTYIQTLGLENDDARQVRGHGTPAIQKENKRNS